MNTFAIEIQGDFNYIVRSFQFVAQMFGADSGYIGLLYVLGVLGIFFGGMAAVAKQGASGRSMVTGWLINMMFSSVIILILIHNKSTVIIHDTTTNQMRSVGQIPTVMAALAYAENVVERGLKDAISTVMQPIIAYDDIGKGKGFELLAGFEDVGKNFFRSNPHIQQSLDSYYQRCVIKDVARNWITIESLHSTSDLWSSMESKTKGYGSIVYSKSDPSGSYKPCDEAYQFINGQMTGAQLKSALTTKCMQSAGKDAAVVEKCAADMESIIGSFIRGDKFTLDINGFIRSYIAAQIMTGPKGAQNQMLADVNKKNMAQAIMAEKMLPRLRGMMYGMIIGIFPLLVGFMWFNPIKTVVFYFGMYLLMVLWGAIDTFMDMQYQNEVYDMFVMIRTNGLGYNQMFDIPNLAADAVSLYGSGRWMALGLATAISGAITGVNTYAMSQMGSQLGSSAQSAAGTGAGYLDSAGAGKLTEQAGNDMAYRIMDTVPNWNAQNIANQGVVSKVKGISGAAGEMRAHGDNYGNLSDYSADSSFFNTATEKANFNQTGNLFGGDYAQAAGFYGATSANTRQYDSNRNQAKLDNMMNETGKSISDLGKQAGSTDGTNELLNISNTDTRLKLHGGQKGLNDFNSKQIRFAEGSESEFLKRQEEQYGDINKAAVTAGTTKGWNQETSNATAEINHDKAIGSMAATENAARAYGFGNDISSYSKFVENGSVLSSQDAARMNQMYGTGVFAAGQHIQAGVGKDGRLNNVSLQDNLKDAKLGGYTMNGSKSVMLGDDMQALQTSYNGVFSNGTNEYSGGIITNGDGNIVNTSGQFGKDLHGKNMESFSFGQSYHVGNETMEQMVRGNKDMWGANVPKAVITDTAQYFSGHYMSDSKISESNIKAGLSSGLLKKIGIQNDAYIAATDQAKADMVNAALQAKHEEISNSDMTNQEKAAARAAYHQEVYNEYLQMVESSKVGRLVDQGAEELNGMGEKVTDVISKTPDKVLKNLPDGNPMGMEDEDGKNWGS